MKIIKKGSYEKILKIKRFECEHCGCIFEADRKEYEKGIQYNETYYYCNCPFCGNKTYKEIVIYNESSINTKKIFL